MKQLFFSILFIISYFSIAQNINIPDSNFKSALTSTNCVDTNNDGFGEFDADINDDGEIDINEALSITGLVLFNDNISSLEGINEFTNLELLLCNSNNLTTLDLSQNTLVKFLNFGGNAISNIDLSANTELIELKCHANQLTSIDVSNSSNLSYFNCSSNQLTSLNVSQNSALSWLICSVNPLNTIDISQNTSLAYLYCKETNLNIIDISQNSNIIGIWCSDNGALESLNLANGNNTNLYRMFAQNNPNLSCIQVDDIDAPRDYCNYYDDDFDGWCKDGTTSYSTNCSVTSVSNNLFEQIELFPNPVTSLITIKNSQQQKSSFEIYSVQGTLIKKGHTTNQIDVLELTSGIYFIYLKVDNKIIVRKFIKK